MPKETNPTHTIVKSTVEVYKIRHTSGCYWADITIDAHERAGRISIASDWGNWSNYWNAAGPDFKTFLGKINQGYAASKFGAEDWIDVSKSLDEFKALIAESEQRRDISAEAAKELRREIKELRGESAAAISQAVGNSEKLYSFLYEHYDYPEFEYKPNPHFSDFWKQAWPLLLAEFAREKEAVPA